MIHIGTQEIRTKRLTLRRFTANDADTMFNNWASDPEVTKFLRWPTHKSVETSRHILESWIKSYEQNDFYLWAIVPDEVGEPIGSIAVVEQDDRIEMVHIGYCIGTKWWHKGYTSEAMAALIEFFFEKVGVNRIESQHDPNNPNSGKVMAKCDMKYEGTHRKADFNNQGIVDASIYAILRDEWKKL
jgi:ribosomal-protein-alanine N-acetyltransferase